jgi:hypothetical protein
MAFVLVAVAGAGALAAGLWRWRQQAARAEETQATTVGGLVDHPLPPRPSEVSGVSEEDAYWGYTPSAAEQGWPGPGPPQQQWPGRTAPPQQQQQQQGWPGVTPPQQPQQYFGEPQQQPQQWSGQSSPHLGPSSAAPQPYYAAQPLPLPPQQPPLSSQHHPQPHVLPDPTSVVDASLGPGPSVEVEVMRTDPTR